MASPDPARAQTGVARSALLLAGALVAAALSMAGTSARGAPLLAAAQVNSGAQVDTAAVGTRIPVILVHGLGGSTEGWENFLQAYGQNPAWRDAFKPYTFRYGTTTAEVAADPAAPRTISGLGAALRDAMQGFYDRPAPDAGFGNKRVIVVAHSMGGLVARSMMQEHVFRDGQRGGQKVLHLITLATPHHGSQLADAAIKLGMQTVSELSDTYPGYLAELAWTNFDGLDSSSRNCNPWLAQLNNYAPSGGASHGLCGTVPANPLPGFYEKIIAYGARTLQTPDFDVFGKTGVYKPGSSSSLYLSYSYLYSGMSWSYSSDGIVPMASAQFVGPSLWQRAEAFACDHRYINRGYQEFVRSTTATYTDWAFCAGANGNTSYPSGTSGGYAVSGSIHGIAGGIIETIKTASDSERVFDWAEQAYAAYLQPAGSTSEVHDGYYYRYYPSTQAHVGVKGGNVYYMGPASGGQIQSMGTLADFLALAQGSGF